MPDNRIARRFAALLLALVLLTAQTLTAFAEASSSDISGSDVSASDTPEEDEIDLELGTVRAKAALLVDLGTLEVLYEQNADEALPPASTTKIMTALLVLEAVERGQLTLDQQIAAESGELSVIPWDASTVNPKISDGETMTVLDYLNCVMLTSDCASCNVLAKAVAGSVDEFIVIMNERAQELGCTDVVFLNAHGYPQEGHVASARSLYLITLAAAAYPTFTEITSRRDYTVPATNISPERRLVNTNSLVVGSSGYGYIYATGVKTGYSKSSGYCLVSTASSNGRDLLAVVLGAEKPTVDGVAVYEHFTESKRLLEWGFNAFTWKTIAHAGFTACEVPLSGGELPNITVVYEESAVALLPVELDPSGLEYVPTLYFNYAAAPVYYGDDYGTMDILRDGVLLATVPLIAGADYPVKEVVDNSIMYIIIGGGVLAFLCLTLAIRSARGRKKGYGYDAMPADPAGDPHTYSYGDRPLYNRRRNTPVARPTYSDGGYYTRRPDPEPDYYADYRRETYSREGSDYDENQEPSAPAPIFPRNWTPPNPRQ